MKTIKYSEKITEFALSQSTPCWSVYAAAQSVIRDGVYAEGHSYGVTRDEAVSGARRNLTKKLDTVDSRGFSKI